MKIFCIGLSKTGTTSLARALSMLGYSTVDNMGATEYRPGDIGCLDIETIDANDAFTDTPIPSYYPLLDRRYPGAKFILTVRDTDAWLKSSKKQFTARHAEQRDDAINRIFIDLYGSPDFDAKLYRDGYRRFIDQAREYFADRPDDLLVIDVTRGNPWDQLCPFLGKPKPDVPFPKANVTRISWTPPERLFDILLAAGDACLRDFNALHGSDLPASGTAGASLSPGRWARLRRRLRGGARGHAERVAKRAYQRTWEQLEAGLRRLTPDIPIVSPETDPTAIGDHSRWNHYWLVSPLDGLEYFSDPAAIFSINLALVQDRVPITGVVHVPPLATSYYAASWRPPVKKVRGVSLSPQAQEKGAGVAGAQLPAMTDREREVLLAFDPVAAQTSVGTAMALYFSAISGRGAGARTQGTREWDTAAIQCVLQAAGYRVTEAGSSAAFSYNRASFANPAIEIRFEE